MAKPDLTTARGRKIQMRRDRAFNAWMHFRVRVTPMTRKRRDANYEAFQRFLNSR